MFAQIGIAVYNKFLLQVGMAKREFIDKNGNTWNWEETPEVIKAVEQLHKTIRELESKASDYGVGK